MCYVSQIEWVNDLSRLEYLVASRLNKLTDSSQKGIMLITKCRNIFLPRKSLKVMCNKCPISIFICSSLHVFYKIKLSQIIGHSWPSPQRRIAKFNIIFTILIGGRISVWISSVTVWLCWNNAIILHLVNIGIIIIVCHLFKHSKQVQRKTQKDSKTQQFKIKQRSSSIEIRVWGKSMNGSHTQYKLKTSSCSLRKQIYHISDLHCSALLFMCFVFFKLTRPLFCTG